MGEFGTHRSKHAFMTPNASMIPIGDFKRAAGFAGIRRLISEYGGNPRVFLTRHGIDPRTLNDSESYVCYSSMIRVLEDCATELNQPFFGFELAKRQGADVIGPPAALLLASPNIAEGLKLTARYFSIHAPGGRIDLLSDQSNARLIYEVINSASRFCRQVNELSLTVAYTTLRTILGKSFKIDAVEICSEAPSVSASHLERFFDAPVTYGQPDSCLRFAAHYLDQKIDSSNATLLHFAQKQCEQLVAGMENADSLEQNLSIQIRRLLPMGGCNLQIVSSQLGIHPRTLQNRLTERGLEFREIVRSERMSLAEAYLSKTRTPVAEVSMLLGYADQTCFTRAFSAWAGCSPRKFRVQRQATTAPHKGLARNDLAMIAAR